VVRPLPEGRRQRHRGREADRVSRANYFHNKWDGTTRSAKKFPFGKPQTFRLCNGTLSTTDCAQATPGVAANNYAGAGWDEEPVTADSAEQLNKQLGLPDTRQAPPTLVFDSAPLKSAFDMAGIPSLKLQIASSSGYQLDPKLYDLSPDGSAKLLTRGAWSEAVGSGALPHEASFDMNGLSNLIPAGHRIRLQLQTADSPYLRPNTNPFAVAVLAGSSVALPTTSALR
jgi:predicted acyl esterase